MKKFKKLFLVVSIVAVLMVMMVVSVSASEYDFQSPSNIKNDNIDAACIDCYCFFYEDNGESVSFYYFKESDSSVLLIRPVDFQRYVNSHLGFDVEHSYSEWFDYLLALSDDDMVGYDSNQYDLVISWKNVYYNCDEAFYNQLYFYDEITQEEVDSIITEKDAVITEKDSTISTLEGEKTALESDVAGLNMQVADLVQDKAQLNASIKSLEKQLQIKVDKAYAEGLTDADNKISVLPIIIAVAFMLEIIALVVFIVARLRKNKSRKH